MKNLFLVLFMAVATAISFTSCDKEEETPNIVDLAKENANLSILVDAVVHAGLVDVLSGTDKYTVFAPTNDAFNKTLTALGVSKVTDINKDVLKKILLYHVVAGEVKSNQLTAGYVKTAATFGTTNSQLSLLVDLTSGVALNKTVKVATADVAASNGVVHVIDGVLTLPTVVNQALNNPQFSTLVLALTRPDLGVDYVALLSGNGPFTVFAPTNAAFAALLTELGATNLSDIDAATLNAVLQYHVVNGANVLAGSLTQNQQVTTYGGGKFNIDLVGGAKIKDARNRTANIIITDVQGDNGVVHAIDKVILP